MSFCHMHLKMVERFLFVLLFLSPVFVCAQRTRSLETLATTMAGSYSSAEQAAVDTSYSDSQLEMVRIWPKRKDGAWLYVEQAAAKDKHTPYRQGVYHVLEVNDSTFTIEMLTITGGPAFYGAYKDPLLLEKLSADSLAMLEGCTITLRRMGASYAGSTNGSNCSNALGNATYATSELTIMSRRFVSWDRGYNAAGEQVWGSKKAGYRFLKRPK